MPEYLGVRMTAKGVGFKGGSLCDGFDGSGEHAYPPFACPAKYSAKRRP